MYKTLLYYKYCSLKNPEKLAKEHLNFCKHNSILGRILIGEEGINGTCAGKKDDIEKYKEFVRAIKGLEDVWFKEHDTSFIPFKKIFVRHKKEIVNFGKKVNLRKKGKYITPEQLNEMYNKNEDFLIFDARNEIESKAGHFKNAITPKIKHFRELPEIIGQYSHLRDKQIILYCTGGIRCEKASALFKKKGFNNVQQLGGGIYNYCANFPNGFFEGACFVFDERMNIAFLEDDKVSYGDEIPEEKIITSCDFCRAKSARIVNDERMGRQLVVCCVECDKKLEISVVKNNK